MTWNAGDTLFVHSKFRVEKISFRASKEWLFTQGSIQHNDGSFFNITGYFWQTPDGTITIQPMIEQREIGILGFILLQHENEPELLVQAKIEPGNVGVVQLAPSCQATDSNGNRAHGGEKPPYLDWFTSQNYLKLYDSMQSEQGTRFLGKQNRNMIIQIDEQFEPLQSHRWLPVTKMLEFLKFSNLVNTDARSVLVCSPWEKLAQRKPFTLFHGDWENDLFHSSCVSGKFITTNNLISIINKLRKGIKSGVPIPLNKMTGWIITEDSIKPIDQKPYQVIQVKVKAIGREVPQWDQPMIQSYGKGRVVLACGRSAGILHFLFQAQIEPGLFNSVELGPTLIVEPGNDNDNPMIENLFKGSLMANVEQSDEGGRFFRDVTQYQVVDLGSTFQSPENYWWLSLKQVRFLLGSPGWFSNESRSVLSLLLTWL